MPSVPSESAGVPSLLVVDDVPTNLSLISSLLAGKYRCRVAVGGAKALVIAERDPQPELILLDVSMPEMDGYEVCRRLKANPRTRDIPVIFLTSLDTDDEEARGFQAGGADFISRPVSQAVLLARVDAHITLSRSKRFLSQKNDLLERTISEKGRQLSNLQNVIILAIASLAETRDTDTDSHVRRVQRYVRELGLALRKNPAYTERLTDEFLDMLFTTCPLHDIGKVGVPDGILFKPSKLSRDEFEEMKRHAFLGGQTLMEVERHLATPAAVVTMAHEIALYHHERWDGSGYPLGLSGDEIPLSARIVAVADTYDALVSPRVYKPAYPFADARNIILRERGRQFEPALVDAFLDCEAAFVAIAEKFFDRQEDCNRTHVLQRLIQEP